MRAFVAAYCLAAPLAAQPLAPLVEVAESTFRMQGETYSLARFEVDAEGLRKAVAHGPAGEDALARALRALREGQVRFRIHQTWTVSASAKRRREFNDLVVKGVWPEGLPRALQTPVARFLDHGTRAVEPGEFWEFEGGGGQPLRGHYNDEPWKVLGSHPMVAVVVGMYLGGPDALPGTRVEFRAGLKRFLERR